MDHTAQSGPAWRTARLEVTFRRVGHVLLQSKGRKFFRVFQFILCLVIIFNMKFIIVFSTKQIITFLFKFTYCPIFVYRCTRQRFRFPVPGMRAMCPRVPSAASELLGDEPARGVMVRRGQYQAVTSRTRTPELRRCDSSPGGGTRLVRYGLTVIEWPVIAPLPPNKPRSAPHVDDGRPLSGVLRV